MHMNLSTVLSLCGITLKTVVKQRWASGTIILSTALVVVVLVGFLSMSNGFDKALANTGSERIAMIMSNEARAELSSQISREQIELLRSAPGIEHLTQGQDQNAILSPELSIIVGAQRQGTAEKVNLTLRGMGDNGPLMRDGFRVSQGRMYNSGANEIIVGEKLAREIEGLSIGNRVRLGGADWQVVGTFSLTGSLFESEIWADIGSVQSAYDRPNQYQSVRAKLLDKDALFDLTLFAASDVRLDLSIQTEKKYLSKQSEGMVNLISYLAWPLAILLSVGTFTGIYNAMQMSISSRRRELTILRQIGFGRASLFASIILESLICALLGAGLGGIFAFFLFDGFLTSTIGNSFDSLSYPLSVGLGSLTKAAILSGIVALVAVLVPAVHGVNQRLRL